MGLDVYLYEYEIKQSQYQAMLVGGEEPEDIPRSRIELPSERHPDHMFKIGYFRSSYNEFGINQVLDTLGIGTLDMIFPSDKDDYARSVNWELSRNSAASMVDKYAAVKAAVGDLAVLTLSHNAFIATDTLPTSSRDAFSVFSSVKESKSGGFENFGNAHGDFFFGEPLRIVGAIPGVDRLGSPCIYAVCRTSDENPDWYLQALEIVLETCEWVLKQPDPSKFLLHWSG